MTDLRDKHHSIGLLSYDVGSKQSGATLIIVLIILLLMMSIGVIAIKQSLTDLKLSTAAQVNKLLFQSNDTALMKVEKESRLLGAPATSRDTLIGYMLNVERNGHQVSLCMRPNRDRLFNLLQVSELNENGDLLTNKDSGYCDPSEPKDYVSEGRVITQLTFVMPIEIAEAGIFHHEVEGTSSNDLTGLEGSTDGNISCRQLSVYVTSLIPSLSDAPSMDISECLRQSRIGTTTVDSCLATLGVSYQTQQQVFQNQPLNIQCVTGD